MYQFKVQYRSTFTFAWMPAFVVSALVLLSFDKTEHVDFRQAREALVVELNKMSPAFAAFEDSRSDWIFELDGDGPQAQVQEEIRAGEVSAGPANTLIAEPVTIERTRISAGLRGPDGRLLPLAQRKEILAREYSAQDLATPSLAERAERLMGRDQSHREEPPLEKVLIQGPKGSLRVVYDSPRSEERPKDRREGSGRTQRRTQRVLPQRLASADRSGREEPAFEDLIGQPTVLAGNVEMVGGLAFLGEGESFRVYHTLEGSEMKEVGVELPDGNFEIAVARLEGHLVAELSTAEGEVLGLGELALADYKDIHPAQARVEDLVISLSPHVEGLNVNLISARSFGVKDEPISEARVLIDGLNKEVRPAPEGGYSDSRVAPNSSYVLRVEKLDHWATLATGMIGDTGEIRVFPDSMVNALLSITLGEGFEEARRNGIVWGRVKLGGRTLSGARVELAGENDHAIYFSQYVPRTGLDSTDDNGLFAFVNVVPGVHAVRVFYRGEYYPAHLVPVEEKHVSYLDVRLAEPNTSSVLSYDGVTREPLGAELAIMGSDEEFRVDDSGRGELRLPGGQGLMFVEADPGSRFELARYAVSRKWAHVDLPAVETPWLYNLLISSKVNRLPKTGIVVGLDSSQDFEVALDAGEKLNSDDIIFFDAKGERVTQGHGVEGGGFILVNVPLGFRSVAILPIGVQGAQLHSVISDDQATGVIPHLFHQSTKAF